MDIHSSIQDLIAESERPKKSRVQDVSQLVSGVCDYAYQHGLDSEDLASIIDLVREPSKLDQTSITTIIKSLYPAQKLPSSLISSIVAALGPSEKKPSTATQNLLLWWLVVVRAVYAEWSVLEKLYSILFNLLDMLSIRANLCRILCLITRRKHVKPWRIYRLHELSQSASNDSGLNALLRVYQTFYPDVIVPQGKSMEVFKGFDKEWIARLNILQEQNEAMRTNASTFEVAGQGHKRRRTDIIPRLQTRRLHENTIPLEELQTVEDIGNKYERIEYPNQIVSALDNQQLQRILMLRDDRILYRRLNDWLRTFFDAHLLQGNQEDGNRLLSEVLEQLAIFCRQTMTIPEAFLEIIPSYLQRWKGTTDRMMILDILSCLDIQPLNELKIQILEPLEQALIDGTETSNLDLLSFYIKLLQSWAARLADRSGNSPELIASSEEELFALASHSSGLITQMLATEPSPRAQVILQAYLQTLANQFSRSKGQSQLQVNLTPVLIYLAAFASPTTFSISSLCSILSTYRDTLVKYPPNQAQPKASIEAYRIAVSGFNGYIMDTCNLLWRGRAFNKTDSNASGCLLPEKTLLSLQRYVESIPVDRRYSLSQMFSLSFHPALSAISIQSIRNMEDRVIADNSDVEDILTLRHAGPATQKSLAQLGGQGGIEVSWLDYRNEVLDDLALMGADGISKLVQGTMTA